MENCPLTGKPCEHKKYIHITEVENYKCVKEVSLCHECSAALITQEEYKKAIIDSLIKIACEKIKAEQESLTKKCCPDCNHSLDDIDKTARLGCAKCYVHFKDELVPIFKKIHHSVQHIGKVPSNLTAKSKEQLEAELKIAIQNENYDQAAKIRDMLK
jgi:protein arginine kinase activator